MLTGALRGRIKKRWAGSVVAPPALGQVPRSLSYKAFCPGGKGRSVASLRHSHRSTPAPSAGQGSLEGNERS